MISNDCFNLITDRWIPVLFEDGTRDTLAPHEIFGNDEKKIVSSINAPRADFNGSLIQFLIGLVQTTLAPKDEFEWEESLENPPDIDEYKQAFNSVSDAFDLNGDSFRFMQDISVKDSDTTFGLENLIPSLSANGFFQKMENYKGICPVCAAMSLFTLQLNGSSLGRGHKTGLRGGGPLTTIILGKNLYQTISLNVLPEDEFFKTQQFERKSELKDIFPWMGPVPKSEEKGTGVINTANASELQMFWGMGLRLFLDYVDVHEGICDICGSESNLLIDKYHVRPYGIAYENWHHVLSPYYKPTETSDEKLPIHLSQGGLNYSHWLGVVQNDSQGSKYTASVVNRFYENGDYVKNVYLLASQKPRLWAFGYDYSNAKARCWYDSRLPIFLVDSDYRAEYENHSTQIVKTASFVQRILQGCVKESLYSGKGPSGDISDVGQRFWTETEPYFYTVLDKVISDLKEGTDPSLSKIDWLKTIRKHSIEEIFDFYSQSQYVDRCNPKIILQARKKLSQFTYPKTGSKIAKILGVSIEKAT